MSDYHCGYVVILEDEIKDEYSKAVIDAIRQLRGVLDVQPVVANAEFHIAKEQARWDVQKQVMDVFRAKKNP